MKLIVGLGNPGKKYAKTRHNIGFRIVDALKKIISDKDIIFLTPDAFMNESGKTVQKALAYYKIPIENLYVIHDEIDLPFGEIRISRNSSSAGHKGVQSIIDELKTQDFTRIRIGIRPRLRQGFGGQAEIDTTKFVLEKFSKAEEKALKDVIKKAVDMIKTAFFTSHP